MEDFALRETVADGMGRSFADATSAVVGTRQGTYNACFGTVNVQDFSLLT